MGEITGEAISKFLQGSTARIPSAPPRTQSPDLVARSSSLGLLSGAASYTILPEVFDRDAGHARGMSRDHQRRRALPIGAAAVALQSVAAECARNLAVQA